MQNRDISYFDGVAIASSPKELMITSMACRSAYRRFFGAVSFVAPLFICVKVLTGPEYLGIPTGADVSDAWAIAFVCILMAFIGLGLLQFHWSFWGYERLILKSGQLCRETNFGCRKTRKYWPLDKIKGVQLVSHVFVSISMSFLLPVLDYGRVAIRLNDRSLRFGDCLGTEPSKVVIDRINSFLVSARAA